MNRHITANLWLLGLTLLICAVGYPLLLLGFGKVFLSAKAEGSFITDKGGKIVGSHLIAQPFTADRYFHPRPSAVSYNAAATGGSNWGANNPNLRKRVVGMLGPMLKYRDGRPVGPDIVAWGRNELRIDRAAVARWTESDPYFAERWGGANAEFLAAWEKADPQVIATWKRENPDGEPTSTELASMFFDSFVKNTAVAWPESDGTDLQVALFEIWWKAHPAADVDPVPADLVMASGCGLDPHISLKGALYQLDRVADRWATTTKRDPAQVKREVEALLREQATSPFGGLAGAELINVLEINVALKDRYGS